MYHPHCLTPTPKAHAQVHAQVLLSFQGMVSSVDLLRLRTHGHDLYIPFQLYPPMVFGFGKEALIEFILLKIFLQENFTHFAN